MSFLFLKTIYHRAKADEFFMGSVVLFAGSLLVGGVNYVYQFLMARMLSVELYGELQSLLAILSVIAVLSGAISLVAIKYTADFVTEKDWNKLYTLLVVFSEKIFYISGVAYIVYVLFSKSIASFLQISSTFSILLLGITFIFSFANSVPFGILRGLQKFKELSVVNLIIAALKVVFSVLFIYMGFELRGAVGAVVVSTILGYIISLFPLKFLRGSVREAIGGKKILRYSLPVLASLFFTTLLWSVDMVLLKHYFNAELAGQYAALAMLGHIIFFVVGPIGLVLFPLAATAHANNNFPAKILKKAIFLTVPVAGSIVILFFFFPQLVISLLVGSKFLSLAPYLGWFGVCMFLYSILSLFANYFLSLGETKNVWWVGLCALLQIVLLVLFHDTLWQVVFVMNVVMAVGVVSQIAYFIKFAYLCPKK